VTVLDAVKKTKTRLYIDGKLLEGDTMHRKVQTVVRMLLGALFLFGGIAFFFTTPPALSGNMAIFFQGLQASGYFFYLLKGTEIVCGLLLLGGFYVPLALVVLAPIVLNILMVHLFLDPSALPFGLGILASTLYLAFFSPSYSPTVRKLFACKSA
jgi:putative oxidoreductase